MHDRNSQYKWKHAEQLLSQPRTMHDRNSQYNMKHAEQLLSQPRTIKHMHRHYKQNILIIDFLRVVTYSIVIQHI